MTELDKGYSGNGGEPPSEVRSMPYFPGAPGQAGQPGQSGQQGPPGSPGRPGPGQSPHDPPLPTGMPLSAPPSPPPPGPAPVPAPVPAGGGAAGPSGGSAPPPYVPAPHAPAPHAMPAQGGRPSGDGPPDGPDAEAVGTGRAVEGRITIEDEVIEKIAAIAALEVAGVVALTGRPGPGPGPAPGPVSAQGAAQGAEPLRRPEPAAGGVRIRLHDDEVTLDLGIAVEYGSVIMDVATVVKANVARVAGLMLGMRVAAVNVAVEDVRMPGPRSR